MGGAGPQRRRPQRGTTTVLERRRRPQPHPASAAPTQPLHRRRATFQAGPLRPLEEPRRPHRATTPRTRLDRQDRPPAVARLPAQRRTPLRLRRARRRRQASPPPLARLGPTITAPRL